MDTLTAEPTTRPILAELWADVVRYPGYLVSDRGRMRSLKRNSDRIMKTTLNHAGYPVVSLANSEGPRRQLFVHRLTLEAFVGPCPPGMEACHADGNRANGHLSNLRWDTRKANSDDCARHGHHMIGTRCRRAVLQEADIPEILRIGKEEGIGYARIADRLGHPRYAVRHVLYGSSWKHVPRP